MWFPAVKKNWRCYSVQIDKKYFIYAGVIVLLILGGWYLFSVGKDVSDNRNRVDAITNQLNTTGKELQNTAAGLNNIQQAVNRSAERVERSETIIREVQVRTDNDTSIINESSKLIDDSQRIISTVRQRGTSEAQKAAN